MFCFGHRGAKGHEPENTLRGIKRAIDLGADGIEIDIHAVHSKLLVVHDATIQDSNSVRRDLKSFYIEELRSIDLGKGERIPFLKEVLECVNGSVVLNIEIKGEGTVELLAQEIERSISSGYPATKLLVSSFHHKELRKFNALGTNVPCGLLLYGVPLRMIDDARSCGCTSIHLHLESVTKELVAEAHGAGMKVYVYTVNELTDIEKMILFDVDGVFSDYPDRVKARPTKVP